MRWSLLLFALFLTSISSYANVLEEILSEKNHLESEILFPNRNLRLYYHGFKTKCSVVVMHGLYQSPKDMIGISEDLFAAGCNVIAPLLPGHWRKDPKALYKISEADWIRTHEKAVLWAADLGEKVSLVGHSLGGLLSFRMALLHPDKIHRLILIAPALKLSNQTLFFSNLGSFFRIDRTDKGAKSEYEQNNKSAIAGIYVQNLIVNLFSKARLQTYNNLQVPFFVISTANDETVQHDEVLNLIQQTQSKDNFILYPKGSPVFHDNIQRNRKDLDESDPLGWENPDFKNMSIQIQKFIMLD